MRIVDQFSPFDPHTVFEIPGSSAEVTTTAPAPSPRMKEIDRSVVDDVGELLRTDDEHIVHRAGPHEGVGLGDAVAVPGAGGADVPSGNRAGADAVGQAAAAEGVK